MPTDNALSAFLKAFLAAADADERLAAIWHYRARHPDPPSDPDAAILRLVIDFLLDHSTHDAPDARLAAVRLLRILWRGLSRGAMDGVFRDVTVRLLKSYPALGEEECAILWDTIQSGFSSAHPREVERLCRELIESEASQCLLPMLSPGGEPKLRRRPAPNHDVARLVIKYAPCRIWPAITRDLWLLYAVVPRRIMRLESTAYWQHVARGMLHRTLMESRPSDLKDATPRFCRWLEELSQTILPESELAPVLSALTGWPLPGVARALERWSEDWWFSGEFRRRNSDAAADIRAALAALGSEVAPARRVDGTGSEPAPCPTVMSSTDDALPRRPE